MRISKLGGIAATAGVVLAVPAVGFAAHTIKPKNGKYTGPAHYKVSGKPGKGTVTIVVKNHRIASVTVAAVPAPLDKKHSHGVECGAANDYSTSGYKRTGGISTAGSFAYTFTKKGKGFADTMTLKGRFTNATHATGTWQDHMVFKKPDPAGVCNTGGVGFAVAHS